MLIHVVSLLALFAGSPLSAESGGQYVLPYGSGTLGKGGFIPTAWIAGGPYVGNTGFKLTLEMGVGGAPAVVILGTGQTRLPVVGIDLLVDPLGTLFLATPVGVLSGTNGAPGVGKGQAALPLPADSNLAGLRLYTQWVLFDAAGPQNLAASDGVCITLLDGPYVAAGGRNLLHEYVPGAASDTSQAFGGNPADVQFSPDGKLAFVAARLGDAVHFYDATTRPLRKIMQTSLPAAVNSLAVHPQGHTIYVISAHRTTPSIAVIDARRGASSFGKVLRTVQNLPATGLGDMEGVSISQDGRTLVVAVMGLVGQRSILVIDTTPGRERMTKQVNISVGGFLTDVDVSATGVWAYGCLAQLGKTSIVIRVHLPTGRVMNQITHTGDFASDIDLDPRARFLVTANPNTSNLSVIDLTPGAGFFTWRHLTTVANARFFSCALTPDGSQVVASPNGTGGFYAFDVKTGAVAWNKGSFGSATCIAVR